MALITRNIILKTGFCFSDLIFFLSITKNSFLCNFIIIIIIPVSPIKWNNKSKWNTSKFLKWVKVVYKSNKKKKNL